MKKHFYFLIILISFVSCNNENEIDSSHQIKLKFTHNWDGTSLSSRDFSVFKFVNQNGEKISIERLRYILSNIHLINGNETYTFSNYSLVDLKNGNEFAINLPKKITSGSYQLKFTFGFKDIDNIDGVYQDLNSVNFNVPSMLGGGYHYMQFDGKYKDSNNQDANFNYHAIRAVDRSDPNNLKFEDTSFEVNIGTISIINNAEITIKVNIAEWFKNPNTWDLNKLNTVLMPNFEAQKLMRANGKTVFSLGDVSQ